MHLTVRVPVHSGVGIALKRSTEDDMTTVLRDLNYAVRVLARDPGFTVVAILVLALAISANTTIFSMIKGVIFRPLPAVAEPEKLVMLVGTTLSGNHAEARACFPTTICPRGVHER